MPNAPKPIPELSEKEKVFFWNKVDENGPLPDQENPDYKGLGRCWSWNAGATKGGYGVFTIGRELFLAHRVSYFLWSGQIPERLLVLHKCDNPTCVNPSHFFLGTHSDNGLDMHSKNRGSRAGLIFISSHPEVLARGEDRSHSKLTDEIVITMRSRASRGESGAKLAREAGVTKEAANKAICGDTWSHLPNAVPKRSRQYKHYA